MQQATETLTNVRDAIGQSLSGTQADTTEPTVGGKLSDAWQNVKEATGIAATNTNEQIEEGKQRAAVKQDETKAQLSAANVQAHKKTAEAQQGVAAAVKDARSDLAERIAPKQ